MPGRFNHTERLAGGMVCLRACDRRTDARRQGLAPAGPSRANRSRPGPAAGSCGGSSMVRSAPSEVLCEALERAAGDHFELARALGWTPCDL
jgi:hypothetical protein